MKNSKKTTRAKNKTNKFTRDYNAERLWMTNFKRVSFDEVIKPLYRKFIEPCLQSFTPTHMQTTQHHGIRLWFDVDSRPIYCCKVKSAFKLPGQIKDPDTNKLENPLEQDRQMNGKDQLWARFNDFEPNRVEVEVDRHGLVFIMTKTEWNEIKRNLKHVG